MEKKHASAAKKLLIFESDLAVSEMRQTKVGTLCERMVKQCKTRLEAFDPLSDSTPLKMVRIVVLLMTLK